MSKSRPQQQKLTVPKGKTSLVARYCEDTPVTKKSFNEQIISKLTYSTSNDKKTDEGTLFKKSS